ncbi:hypothetical protein A4C53_RS10810 [Elizabethkingia anophelis]|uniref:hypothetical protein n=1 Tax=Elizabethkingia anophelis TaxID=1117645 RepID=UPI00077EA4FF|nr:hypothetical protein [Elizabethkingia anophelis]AMR42755.1 hypothetical protein A2T74_15960 [Elizabethkingia anophelis]AMX49398.1 hypothetical protein A4C56_15960 [Elizabethkingia anophelis]AMX52853.1 hypothetical protein A2T72_15955 [Elizabethkingia anophelis]AMX56247.1 hypothetical protein A2T59_15960 [Elizabethkingia anophelis]EGT4347050.1 hypothetical protein [Elizabethkingia anophelis]
MKKQAINKKLLFKKEIVKDLKSISGGIAPETQPVNTYGCGETYGYPCGPDPYPNLNTCDCVSPIPTKDTFAACATGHGYGCVTKTFGCTNG